MANIIPTIESLEAIFADLITTITGLSQDKVIIQNMERGSVAPKYGENIIFVRVDPETDENDLFKDRKLNIGTTNTVIEQTSMKKYTLGITIYGINYDVNAQSIIEYLFTEIGRQYLEDNRISLIPSSLVGPIRMDEPVDGRWWKRSDLKISFYSFVEYDIVVNTFEDYNIITNIDN